jgi:hypothetical protein
MFYQVIKILSLLAKLEFFNLDTHEAFNDFCALVIVNPEFKKNVHLHQSYRQHFLPQITFES